MWGNAGILIKNFTENEMPKRYQKPYRLMFSRNRGIKIIVEFMRQI
ncbi:hypothetical protein ES705_05395 [subsurface metagenome]